MGDFSGPFSDHSGMAHAGVEKREIARRLRLDIKTVRRHIRRIEAGIVAPARTSPGSKLDRYAERIAELAALGWTAWNVHVALREDPDYTASYELVKKRVALLRHRDPRVYERVEHLPGAEMQADFGELVRVQHPSCDDVRNESDRGWAEDSAVLQKPGVPA
jgi:hypothetical protein